MGRRKRHRKPRSAEKRPIAPPSPKGQAKEEPSGDSPGTGPGVDRWRPWLLGGLVALLVLRPLFPSESAALEGDGLVVVMLWIALAAFWLLGAIGRPWFAVRFGWTDVAVLLLIGWHTIAALWAANHASPRPALNMLWEWIAYGLCYLLARQLIAGRREMRAVIVVMIALAVALAGYGLYQHLWELPETRAKFERDPDVAMRDSEIWFEPGSREFELFRARLDTFKPMATFALTNSLAGYLAPWLVVAAGIGLSVGLSRKRWRSWLAVIACGVPVLVCLILTSSRSACGAAVLGLVLVGLSCRRGKTRPARRLDWRLPAAVAGVAAILVAAVVVVGASNAKLLSGASKSLGYRVQYWESTLRMIADHPIAGCGPGNFQDTYTRYMLPEASEEIADPHNFLMEVWATAGTPSLLALLAVLGAFAYALLRGGRLQQSSPRESSAPVTTTGPPDATRYVLAGAACGFLLSVLVGQMSSAPPSAVEVMPGVWAPVVVLLGLPLAAVTVLLFWEWINDGRLTPWLPAIGVVVLLVNLLAAGAMGFPGVAGTFWVLVAMGLSLTEASRPFRVPRSAGLAALAAAMAAALTCSATALNPVLRSQMAIRLAERDPVHAGQHLRDAAQADPLAAAPQRHVAEHAFGVWLDGRSPKAFDRFEASMQAALDLAPNSASKWRMCGDRYLEAFEERGLAAALPKAVFAHRRAVDLYPNDAELRSRLAASLRAGGDEAGFRRQAAIALELDEQTPHSDKKLEPRVRDELRRALSRSSSREE